MFCLVEIIVFTLQNKKISMRNTTEKLSVFEGSGIKNENYYSEEYHIGKKIQKTIIEQGRSVKWLSNQLGCSRDNVYKIYQRQFIDTDLLFKISMTLDYDFFADYSEFIKNKRQGRTGINV